MRPRPTLRRLTPPLLAVAALGVAGCGEGVPSIDTGEAETALDELADAVGVPTENSFAVLADCPIDDHDLLLERALRDADDPLLDEAFAAEPIAFVTTANEDPDADPYLLCGRLAAADSVGVAIVVGDAPGEGVSDSGADDRELSDDELDDERAEIAARYAGRFGDPPGSVTVDRRIDTRGGTMYHVCISEPSRPERDSCEVVWFGGDLTVSTIVTGPGALEIDLTAIDEPMRRVLQLVVDGLADGAAVPS